MIIKDKVSFLIAVYNGENVIEFTINNIISNLSRFTNLEYEIIIIDDNSNDKTWDTLKKLTNLSSKILIFKNDKNLGFSSTIYKAMELSSGNYIKLMHAADFENTNLSEFLSNYKNYDILLVDLKDNRDFLRKNLSVFCNSIFRIITSKKIKYYSSAFLCSKDLFKSYFVEKNYRSFFLPVMISKILLDGYSYKEIKVETNQSNKSIKLKSNAINFKNLISFFHAIIDVIKYKSIKILKN